NHAKPDGTNAAGGEVTQVGGVGGFKMGGVAVFAGVPQPGFGILFRFKNLALDEPGFGLLPNPGAGAVCPVSGAVLPVNGDFPVTQHLGAPAGGKHGG